MNEKQKQIHKKIDQLFREIEVMDSTEYELIRQKITIVLNMIKIEFKKLRLI